MAPLGFHFAAKENDGGSDARVPQRRPIWSGRRRRSKWRYCKLSASQRSCKKRCRLRIGRSRMKVKQSSILTSILMGISSSLLFVNGTDAPTMTLRLAMRGCDLRYSDSDTEAHQRLRCAHTCCCMCSSILINGMFLLLSICSVSVSTRSMIEAS
ncbi:hypothetical protein FCM35_KLT04184 [Carex littledalei]|uniref:Uncharacterized protein n=1 Tax=Carex littledalei TaxID=544730 RepID=A0A833QP74_9POAL|nr:hypothetical protein FCM35_KLT04184 [Carex littledalei]